MVANIAKFLGYEISVRKSDALKRNAKGHLKREFGGRIVLTLPLDTVKKKLLGMKAMKIKMVNGQEVWWAMPRKHLTGMKPDECCAQYTKEIRGFYQYYRIANNASYAASKFGYIMRYSFYKTLALKLNASMREIINRYRKDNDIVVPYKNSRGEQKYRIFYNDGFARQQPNKEATCDNLPNTFVLPSPTLAERLLERRCELCGATNVEVEMYQVRNLKNVKPINEWDKIMLGTWRKTLVVCKTCSCKVHGNGK